MFAVSEADLVAIQRAFLAGGRNRALVELRRRYLLLNDQTAPEVLDRILQVPVNPPPGRPQA